MEMSIKLQNEFTVGEMTKELRILFKKYDLNEMIKSEAKQELEQAKECLEKLEMNTAPLQPLTLYSMI